MVRRFDPTQPTRYGIVYQLVSTVLFSVSVIVSTANTATNVAFVGYCQYGSVLTNPTLLRYCQYQCKAIPNPSS